MMKWLLVLASFGAAARGGSCYELGDVWGMVLAYGFAALFGFMAMRLAASE